MVDLERLNLRLLYKQRMAKLLISYKRFEFLVRGYTSSVVRNVLLGNFLADIVGVLSKHILAGDLKLLEQQIRRSLAHNIAFLPTYQVSCFQFKVLFVLFLGFLSVVIKSCFFALFTNLLLLLCSQAVVFCLCSSCWVALIDQIVYICFEGPGHFTEFSFHRAIPVILDCIICSTI